MEAVRRSVHQIKTNFIPETSANNRIIDTAKPIIQVMARMLRTTDNTFIFIFLKGISAHSKVKTSMNSGTPKAAHITTSIGCSFTILNNSKYSKLNSIVLFFLF